MWWDVWKKKLYPNNATSMSVDVAPPLGFTSALRLHPNDVDRKRIERSLDARKRYRYVKPEVSPVHGGYRITSPCCSRKVDSKGGVIDIALFQYDPQEQQWCLYRRDHAAQEWVLYNTLPKLQDLLQRLNEDPFRIFWQ